VADTIVLTSDDAATFTWNEATDDNVYTLYVFKLSDNVRIGVTLQVGLEAADVCVSGVCSYSADPSDFDTGKYAWTVVADGVGAADVEASNGGIVFSVNIGDIELVVNGGFEVAGTTNAKAANWKGSKLTNDKRTCNNKGNGSNCALTFTGGTPVPMFKQVLNVAPYAIDGGESLTLSADISSSKAAPGIVVFVNIVYFDTTAGANNNGKDKLVINPTGLAKNTYTSLNNALTLDGAVKKATVVVQYRQTSGKLSVDNVSVFLTGNDVPRSGGAVLPLPGAPDGFRGNN